MPNAAYFPDDLAVLTRAPQVPAASFDNGLNLGGSCAPGIGIGVDAPNVVGTPEQFTLFDQNVAARTPQDSMSIGAIALDQGGPALGNGQPVLIALPDASGDGSAVPQGAATLLSLVAGWTAV